MRADPLAEIPNAYPIEIAAPDISAYAEGTGGVPYVHTFRGASAGTHVALAAIVHGNEPCGAVALDTLLREGVRPIAGALSFVFVNVAAYEAFDRDNPNASRWVEEDFNRLWSDAILSGERDSVELRRARELRPFLDTVDLLLDIHSMQHKTLPLLMSGPTAKGRELALKVGAPATVVADGGHAAGPRMRDYADFVAQESPKNALLVECGQHWEANASAVALDTAARFLRATGAVGPDALGHHLMAPDGSQRVIEITERVTVTSEAFSFVEAFSGMEVIPAGGTVIARDGDAAVRTPYDDCVLIMPSKRLWPGQTAVRLGRFVG